MILYLKFFRIVFLINMECASIIPVLKEKGNEFDVSIYRPSSLTYDYAL